MPSSPRSPSSSLPTVCLYIAGTPAPALRAAVGAYQDWFAPLLAQHAIDVELHHGQETGLLPEGRERFAGVIITGSPASVTEPEPWMEAAIEWIREAYETGTPLLGVCFGHQLIGAAFGASVVRNPAGWHMGTRELALLPGGTDDPLFQGLPMSFPVNVIHQDIIDATTLSPMNGIRALATSDRSPVFAVAAGPSVRGVQFHPEVDSAIARAAIDHHGDSVRRDAENRGRPDEFPEQLAARAEDTPVAAAVLHNFIRHFVLG